MKREVKTEATRRRMLRAAGNMFRKHGLGGTGVDGLAREAHLTSGAFYVHFGSKMEAFVAAIEDGLTDLKRGIADLQDKEGPGWVRAFAGFYLGFKRTCSLEEACTVPVLSSEVERAGDASRAAYEARIKEVFEQLAKALPAGADLGSMEKAYALMALLAGGAILSRTVLDPELSERIAAAVQSSVSRLTH